LQGEEQYADLAGIEAVAERLASGEEATYAVAAVAPAPAAPQPEAAPEVAAVEPAPVAAAPAPVVEVEAPAPEPVPEEGTGAFSIDPVLLEILKPEVAGHLEIVDAWLAACAARGPQPVTDPLLRSIHTMNGAFAMTELEVITDVTAPLEGYVKRALAHHKTPTSDAVRVVQDAAAAIRTTIAAIEKPRPVLPRF
jgi:chemosensory pili system protein ChpA (sensor histidine kinase/response regulator)